MEPEQVDPGRYDTHLDVKYGPGQRIDVGAEAAARQPWFNQTLTRVNGSVVRLGVIEGSYHWHRHAREDEFFLVLEGHLDLDLEGEEPVGLDPLQGYTVAAGRLHRTRAPGRTVILMVEAATVTPTGDGA